MGQPQPKKYEATRHPTLLSQKCRTLYFSNDILDLPLIKYLTLHSMSGYPQTKNHHRRSCTKLTARKPLKLHEVEFVQNMLLICKRIVLRVIPLQRRRRQHNQEEQPATRKQVFSPTLEIRSYQQVDRILISSEGGCWLNLVTNTKCNTCHPSEKHPKPKRQCSCQKTSCEKTDITVKTQNPDMPNCGVSNALSF